jgi:penicillin-binding protein 1A
VLSEAKPAVAGSGAERAIDPRNAFIMTSMMRDVIAYGTATGAQVLKRRDIAGKTGTTNDNIDAWFCGFNSDIVGVAWIGFDQPRTLGTNETGGVAALPIWIAFMQKQLKGTPEKMPSPPDGVVSLRINADSGLRDDTSTLSDYFYSEFQPRARDDGLTAALPGKSPQEVRDQIF